MSDKPKPWVSWVGLVVLLLYVLSLVVLTVDEVFDFGLIKTESEKRVMMLLDLHATKAMDNPQQARAAVKQCLKTFERTRAGSESADLVEQLRAYVEKQENDLDKAKQLLAESRDHSSKRLANTPSFISIPLFIKTLKCPQVEVRRKSHELLKATATRFYGDKVPADGLGFNPEVDPKTQQAQIDKWQAWWKQVEAADRKLEEEHQRKKQQQPRR